MGCGAVADGARAGVGRQVGALERWNPGQHVVTESLSGAIVTQTIICHGPSHPKLPQPSPGKHTGVAEFVFSGAPAPPGGTSQPRMIYRRLHGQNLTRLAPRLVLWWTNPV